MTRTQLAWLLAGVALLLVAGVGARAEGRVLDGRTAPDFVFPGGRGVEAGTRLSDYRGQVVWIKFVLRDCPRCLEELPRAQDRHDRWGGSGLVVLVVMHEHPPSAWREAYDAKGWTFPVGSDPEGRFARAWGVGRRPTDYVVGADGRVRASNRAPDDVLLEELARRRVARLGEVPPEEAAIREHVWRWDYGAALRLAEALLASEEASEAARRVATRVRDDAATELDARLAHARRLEARGETEAARTLLDRLVRHFEGTALEARAREARDALRSEPDR